MFYHHTKCQIYQLIFNDKFDFSKYWPISNL
jgi:hypothetical protein